MLGTRTYYCEQCKKCIDFQKNDLPECKCGKIFGLKANDTSGYNINMRNNKWSSQTKVEFSTTTMDKDIADRNNR